METFEVLWKVGERPSQHHGPDLLQNARPSPLVPTGPEPGNLMQQALLNLKSSLISKKSILAQLNKVSTNNFKEQNEVNKGF
jgi:hypothetical protein